MSYLLRRTDGISTFKPLHVSFIISTIWKHQPIEMNKKSATLSNLKTRFRPNWAHIWVVLRTMALTFLPPAVAFSSADSDTDAHCALVHRLPSENTKENMKTFALPTHIIEQERPKFWLYLVLPYDIIWLFQLAALMTFESRVGSTPKYPMSQYTQNLNNHINWKIKSMLTFEYPKYLNVT